MSACTSASEGRLEFFCPACKFAHAVRVAPAKDPWVWNGSFDRPTLSPSVKVFYHGTPPLCCHSYVEDGKIRFLSDCTHSLAGSTVDLPEWP